MFLVVCLLGSGGGAIMMKRENKSGGLKALINNLSQIQLIKLSSGQHNWVALSFGLFLH